MALEVGQRVGDYEILALLGAGGMGRVYKVRNIISNREEAMKVLLPDYASEPELAARFMTEIRTLAGLEHPNIAQLRTAFQSQNQFVMIMEFVEGTTLEKLASQSQIPLDRVLEYSTQVLSALSYAHSRGVTHRDIKPANIMITSHGLVKLMDFGIAKSTNDMQLTRPGTTMGSVYYMSPEQVRGGTVDARSDIYSFGVTLYEMLTGRRPFQADTSYSVLNAQLNEAPMPPAQVNPALSQELNNIVLRAMVKRPDGRFQSAEEFRNALKSVRPPEMAQSVPPASPDQQGQRAQTVVESGGFTPVPRSGSTTPMPIPSMQQPVQMPAQAAPYTPPAPAKSHRGLWIGLGAVAAVLALVAAATLLPPLFKTNASSKTPTSAATTDTSAPATSAPAASAPAPTTSSEVQQPNPLSQPVGPDAMKKAATPPASAASLSVQAPAGMTRPMNAAAAQPPAQTSAPPTAAPAPSPQEVQQARRRFIDLDARAGAARDSIETMRKQQQAQGYDMRGDVVTSMNKMNSYLSEANRALGQNDLQTANEYMDRADVEIANLEKFLGR
ncbi:MAG TPA: serine/threonine-protein kinase [Alloacidobacterium sp.]|nr:serine/threonine-protein kinase [Alloacidobacterium sp.]